MSELTKSNNGARMIIPKKWGTMAAKFLAAMRGEFVQIVMLDGKLYKGVLMGVDTYDLIIKQSNDTVAWISKRAVKIITWDVCNS